MQALTVKYSKMLRSKEFAHQLHLLCNELPISHDGTTAHNSLTNWLVAVLTCDTTETTSTTIFPVVTKKIRDEYTKTGDVAQAFRRSAIYTVTKAILQHNLVLHAGEFFGHLYYKIIFLRFMDEICVELAESPSELLNTDLMSQMIAKMGRRIEKLHAHIDNRMEMGERADQFSRIIQSVIGKAKKTISKVRNKIDDKMVRLHQSLADASTLARLENLALRADSQQRIPTLREYIEGRNAIDIKTETINELIVKPVKRHYDRRVLPRAADLLNCSSEYLLDIEYHVLHHFSIEQHVFHTKDIKEYMDYYAKRTKLFYTTGDKLSISRAILTQLKLLAMCDRYVCRKYPQLLEHRPSINFDWFNKLLLPYRADMEQAYGVEDYFKQRRANAVYPGLIDDDKIKENSFAVRFAQQNDKMERTRDKIIAEANKQIKDKKEEWLKQRTFLEKNAPHECGHSSYNCECPHCVIRKQSEIRQYEYPLPSSEVEQYAVVFELSVPRKIANLRDSLYIFSKCGMDKSIKRTRAFDWNDHSELGQHNKADESRNIRLGHTSGKKPRSLHVNESFDKFILRNARNCFYHASGERFGEPLTLERIHAICTLPVEPNSSYANLQWMVNDTTHSQNEVLAKQNECAATLSLNEYKNFGSLRADGCRLQWRQLYAMIECDALAFEQASVLALCLQAIWEQNSAGAYGWLRNANVDTQNVKFVVTLLNELDTYLDRQRNNWMHPLKLVLIASMAVRLFELNGDEYVMQRIAELLYKIRTVVFEWRGKIEQVFRAVENPSTTDEKNMRQNLVFTMIAGCITFYVHQDHAFFKHIFREEDACTWLQMIVTLNNNKVLMGDEQPSVGDDLNMNMWLQLVQNIGVNLEPTMRNITEQNQTMVLEYIQNEHMHANAGRFEKLYFKADCLQTLVVEMIVDNVKTYVTIDIIVGLLLVNGSPIVRLPREFHFTISLCSLSIRMPI